MAAFPEVPRMEAPLVELKRLFMPVDCISVWPLSDGVLAVVVSPEAEDFTSDGYRVVVAEAASGALLSVACENSILEAEELGVTLVNVPDIELVNVEVAEFGVCE